MANEVKVHIGQEPYTTEITVGEHRLTADEPTDLGGGNKGPAPTELLLASLGSCKAITMRMYAANKGWNLTDATVRLSMETVKSEQQQTAYIRCHIELDGDLDDDQRNRLLAVADKCPMHKILTGNVEINSNILPQ